MTSLNSALDTAVCSDCGHQNVPGARFCSDCGRPLLAAQSATELTCALTADFELEPLVHGGGPGAWEPSGTAELIVFQGPLADSRFALRDDPTTIGRDPESTIFLDDITVSRRHAQIVATDTVHVLHDLGSLNGTYVNGERVDQRTLADADELQIGKFRLVFRASALVEIGGV